MDEKTRAERDAELEEKYGSIGKSTKPVSWRDMLNFLDIMTTGFAKYRDDFQGRITALEKDNAELRAAGAKSLADFYRGVWQPSAFDPYARGSAVTFDGSLWVARTETRAKPGTGDDWQLAVKRGHDGKDAR